jgi:hypothetical protein
MSDTPFHDGYFLRGEGSNYIDYSWMPEATIPLAATIKRLLGINDGDRLLDVGAARGYLVKAMRMLRVEAFGYDVSEWAVANCHFDVTEFMRTSYDPSPMSYDFITAKDVFEHIHPDTLKPMLSDLTSMMRQAMLIVVPLAVTDGGPYICPKDEQDTTHINRWTLPTWIKFLESIDRRLVVSGGYYVPGIKQANSSWEHSCGFITIKRI